MIKKQQVKNPGCGAKGSCGAGTSLLERRDFIKATGLTAAMVMAGKLPVMAGPFDAKDFDDIIPADKKLSRDWIASLYARGNPMTVKAGDVDYIGMPINGICTGQVYLSGDGQLWFWNMTALKDEKHIGAGPRYRQPDRAQSPAWQGFAVQVNDKVHTLDSAGFSDVTFTNHYPMAVVDYADSACPVKIQLEAYTPFIPLNRDESSYPVIVMRYTLTNTSSATEDVNIAGWIENNWNGSDSEKVNYYREVADISAVECSDETGKKNSLALGIFGSEKPELVNLSKTTPGVQDVFSEKGNIQGGDRSSHAPGQPSLSSIGRRLVLKPGESKTISFAVSWRFPEIQYGTGTGAPKTRRGTSLGRNHYATLWPSATEASGQVARREDELYGNTKKWVDTWYDSTLPYWFLERAFIPIDCMQTQLAQRVYPKGSKTEIYNMEEGVRCCPGNCTHVWNYAQGLARIFPEIERECRNKIEYGLGFDESNGRIYMRYTIQRGKYGIDALDGTCGTIVRVLRESQMTTDYSFLAGIWDKVKRSMDFVIQKWDPEEDGILAGAQDNTLDEPWFGKVHWLINVYHAALKAAAVMARQMNQSDVAARYEGIVKKGAPAMVDLLWNEEFGYFVHIPPQDERKMHGSTNGCHIDQVLGDSWMHEVGLDPILPRDKVLKSLQALWTYNFTPDVGAFRKVVTSGRWYAEAGDAGLVMCTFPNGKVEPKSGSKKYAGYLNECMTGFEWQVAAHMIREGMIEKGLAIGKAIYDRYSPEHRNPYNEIECSDHYSRAMASYGAFLAACGYRYDGPEATLGFGPKLSPEDFRAAFTTAEGWGRFTQKVNDDGSLTAGLQIQYGKLTLKEFSLDAVKGFSPSDAEVLVGEKTVKGEFAIEKDRYRIRFSQPLNLQEGESALIKYT